MGLSAPHRFSFAQYVEVEAQSPIKHEFLNGWVWAMAGGSPEHARISASVARMLGNALERQPCAVYSSDLRIRVKETGLATYPDVTVVCGPLESDPDDPSGHSVINPLLVVEVLSPSTEAYDRGDKLAHYKRVPSLKHVLLLASEEPRAELWTRNGEWTRTDVAGEDNLPLAHLNVELDLKKIYASPLP
ncbi:MAG: Uma2 family endonuclease [Myxococcota bacterium]